MRNVVAIDTHRHPASSLVNFFLLAAVVLAQNDVPKCYYPNGSIAQRDYACVLSANVSFCCGLGTVCLDNGVCGTGNGKRIRGSCTDQSWGPGCPQWCLGHSALPELPRDPQSLTNPTDADRGGNDLIPCENVTSNPLDFCCDGNSLCCDGGGGRFRLDSVGEPFRTLSSAAISATRQPKSSTSSKKVASIPATTSTSATSIPAVTTNPASTSVSSPPPLTPDPPSASPDGLSTGAKAAIGIGAAFGSTILLAAVLWLWWRKKRSSTRTVQTLPQDDGPNNNSTPNDMHQQQPPATAQNGSYYGSGLYELSGEHHRELSGKPHYEMPSGNHHQQAWEMPERVRSRSLR
ncbi:MAG: hypothetical protein LQ339_003972 [Xanthoria mediterranea]|nr:MAG: hypothetical protein LQ339_003972 [Xanthoria mediterranea]